MSGYDNYNFEFRRQAFVEPFRLVAGNNIFTPTVDQRAMLGCKLELNDGRIFRYTENAGTQLAKALMNQQAAATGNWQNESQANGTAADIGDKVIEVAVSTAPTLKEWDNGYMIVQDGTGEQEMYIIKEHEVSTTPLVSIADQGGIRVATLATSGTEMTFVKNLYKDVIVHPTTATGKPIGVALSIVPVNRFFWSQTRGPCPMLVDNGDTLVIGEFAGLPGTAGAAGEVGTPLNSSTTLLDGNVWGYTMDIGAADETALIYLTLE